jgi:hypothetical protein
LPAVRAFHLGPRRFFGPALFLLHFSACDIKLVHSRGHNPRAGEMESVSLPTRFEDESKILSLETASRSALVEAFKTAYGVSNLTFHIVIPGVGSAVGKTTEIELDDEADFAALK